MKVLVIGLGSIGERHFKNLQSLGVKEAWGYDPDRKRRVLAGARALSSLSPRTLKKFDAAVIANPTAAHVKTATQCAKAGLHLFIEKPVSHKLQGLAQLQNLCKRKRLVNFVACNYRFHPAVRFLQKALSQKRIGKPRMFEFAYGRYLPYQRPWQEYRTTYTAKRRLGGGVLLDAAVHDADLLLWLNGFPRILKKNILCAKVSKLDIDTEDVCSAHVLLANGAFGVIRADYLQQVREKTVRIVGEKGTLVWDSWDNTVLLEHVSQGREQKKLLWRGSRHDQDEALREEMRYFLSCVRRRRQTSNTVGRASETLRFLLQ